MMRIKAVIAIGKLDVCNDLFDFEVVVVSINVVEADEKEVEVDSVDIGIEVVDVSCTKGTVRDRKAARAAASVWSKGSNF